MEKFIRTLADVNFCKSAATNSAVIKILKKGTELQVTGVAPGTWYSAKLSDGTSGYISSKPEYVENFTPDWAAKAYKLIQAGTKYLGVPYVFGSSRTTDKDFDCSDFCQWLYEKQLGLKLPWDSRTQSTSSLGQSVALDKLRSGDLVFFDTGGKGTVTHVAMYVHDGKLLHTYNKTCDILNEELKLVRKGGGGVSFTTFAGYWRGKAVSARRFLK